MTIEEIEAAFMDLVRWKQQELAQRATPAPASVTTLDGYIGLWQLRREWVRLLAETTDLPTRLDLQQSIAGLDHEIAAAKADPRLAPQITQWWLSRQTQGGHV